MENAKSRKEVIKMPIKWTRPKKADSGKPGKTGDSGKPGKTGKPGKGKKEAK